MENEVKTAVEALAGAFEEFKKVNDTRLAEIEAKGTADPMTEQKLAKIEADLDKFENINQAITQQQKHAEGFIRLYSLSSRIAALNAKGIAFKNTGIE